MRSQTVGFRVFQPTSYTRSPTLTFYVVFRKQECIGLLQALDLLECLVTILILQQNPHNMCHVLTFCRPFMLFRLSGRKSRRDAFVLLNVTDYWLWDRMYLQGVFNADLHGFLKRPWILFNASNVSWAQISSGKCDPISSPQIVLRSYAVL